MPYAKWIEVWIKKLSIPPYLNLLSHYADGTYLITDPQDKTFSIRFQDLEEAKLWLEDEFTRVDGRIEIGQADAI